jgi:transcriptional regulator with XRE-family HTH domain
MRIVTDYLDITTYKSKYFGFSVRLWNMQNKTNRKSTSVKQSELNPTYMKIGKRLRQARLSAKVTNSREFSLGLGWSAGRINNFELGISTPGPDETEILAEKFKVNPAWITYGVEPMRSSDLYSTRYCNFIRVIEAVEATDELIGLLEAVKLTVERLEKIKGSPHKKIPNVMARRCEKYLKKPKGWLDEKQLENRYCEPMPADIRDLVSIYVRLPEKERAKLCRMGEILLGEFNLQTS